MKKHGQQQAHDPEQNKQKKTEKQNRLAAQTRPLTMGSPDVHEWDTEKKTLRKREIDMSESHGSKTRTTLFTHVTFTRMQTFTLLGIQLTG